MKIIKFEASWCGPCQKMTSIIKNIKEKIPYPVEVVDIDENFEQATKWNVRGVPTLILVNNDEVEIKRHTGVLREPELLAFLEQ